MSITWDSGNTKLTVEKNGLWHELSSTKERHPLRKQFRSLAATDLPFKGFLTFPESPSTVVIRLWAPWELDRTVELIKDVVEGTFTTLGALALPSSQTMKVPYGVSVPSVYLKPVFNPSAYEKFISANLKVDEIAFFHFLKKGLSKEANIAIKRELQEKKLLSESRRNSHPLLKGSDFGVTLDADRKRNDDHYVHCFVGYPLLSNDRRISRIPSVLSQESMIKIGFQDLQETVIVPYDMQMDTTDPFTFTFMNEEYSIQIDATAKTIIYSSKSKGVLLTHRCADETFFASSRASINALIAVLVHFACQLEDAQKYDLLKNDHLLPELFNDLFAFRAQLSIPGELECRPWRPANSARAQIEQQINKILVQEPDLEACKKAFQYTYSKLPDYLPQISSEIDKNLKKIITFFTSPLNDGTNAFPDAFAYYGATSSQLLLHFDPELAELFTEDVVKFIMQLQKCYQRHPYPYTTSIYKSYLLIKETPGNDITIFSLIKRGLEDLHPIQYRLPPNRPFNRPSLQVELDYQLQLKIFTNFGSPLLKAICSTAYSFPEMFPFSQDRHLLDTVSEGIKRLIYPVEHDASTFANVHGYSPDAFTSEFERGLKCYIDSFEITHQGVVQSHVVDFVQRLVRGQELLEPRFKHDLLDLKHFIAGISNDKAITFVDGNVTFRELVLRCLYEIQNQTTITINSHLLINTVAMALKTVKAPPEAVHRDRNSNPTLEALQQINMRGYQDGTVEKVINFLRHTNTDHFPYVIKCLNLMRLRMDNSFIQASDLTYPLRAIQQKLYKLNPDAFSESYFMIFPTL